jgi:MFS transporter, DHA1 family, multidrug resistance protein
VLTTGLIVVADISTPAQRGRAMATYQGVFLFAVGVGPFPGGLLAAHFGLRAPFLVYAVAGVAGAILAWLIIPETRRTQATADTAPALPFLSQIGLFMGRTGFVLVSLVSFTNAVARTGGLFNVIPVLARDRLSLSTDRLGFGLALASLTGLVLTYPAGVLVDRYGRKAVIVPSTVISGIALLMFLRAPSYAWFLAACVVWSMAMGVSGAAPAAYAADVVPPGMNAAAMSTFRMLSDLGYVVGPIVLGLAADAVGANATLAATAALLVIVGAVFLRWAPETYRMRF